MIIEIEMAAIHRRARVIEASLDATLSRYRMAGFPRPFRKDQRGQRFNHLFPRDVHLAICGGLAVVKPERLQPVDLAQVDCLACLDELTKRIKP